jgi:cell division protein FtsL
LSTVKNYILPIIVGICALAVSGSAAYYSVFGLSKLFAGASTEVIIMAGSLEMSKLVIASVLYRYWDELNKALKYYLTVATVTLVLITSLGIYGFLTSAYQTTSDELAILDRQVQNQELRKQRYSDQINLLTGEQEYISRSITELSAGLSSGTTVQYVDQTGQLITTSSSSARRTLESQLNNAISQRDRNYNTIQALSDSMTTVEFTILDLRQNSSVSAEVGPLRFMAEITGLEMNSIVNIFTLLIVLVFDPLAISLVIVANFTILRLSKESKVTPSFIPNNTLFYGETKDKTKVEEINKPDLPAQQEVEVQINPIVVKDILQKTPTGVSVLTKDGNRIKLSKEEFNKANNKTSEEFVIRY